MVAAAVILAMTVAHGAWGQSPPAQAPDQRNRDGAPGSVTLPRIRPTAVDGIRTGAAPVPAPAEEPVMPEAAGEPAADAPADAPAAPPTARPIAVIQEATPSGPVAAPTTVAMPAPAAAPAPAWTMPITPDAPTLALLTMLVPAGVAAAWALSGLGRRPGEG